MRALKDAVEIEIHNLAHIIAKYEIPGDLEVNTVCQKYNKIEVLRKNYEAAIHRETGRRNVALEYGIEPVAREADLRIKSVANRVKMVQGKKIQLLQYLRDRVNDHINYLRSLSGELGIIQDMEERIKAHKKKSKKRSKK